VISTGRTDIPNWTFKSVLVRPDTTKKTKAKSAKIDKDIETVKLISQVIYLYLGLCTISKDFFTGLFVSPNFINIILFCLKTFREIYKFNEIIQIEHLIYPPPYEFFLEFSKCTRPLTRTSFYMDSRKIRARKIQGAAIDWERRFQFQLPNRIIWKLCANWTSLLKRREKLCFTTWRDKWLKIYDAARQMIKADASLSFWVCHNVFIDFIWN